MLSTCKVHRIDLIYIDSGGGHRAAAAALAEAVRQQDRDWVLRFLNIQDLLNSIDFIRKSTGIPFQDVYNIMLRHGWTAGSAQLVPLMHLVIRLLHREQVRVLERHWKPCRPDMVVSLIPHYNRALRESLQRTWPGTPFVTLLTDIADFPPHFWIEAQDQHVICGSDRAVQQARRLGLPESRILRTSGMILNPKFHAPPGVDRENGRIRVGLEPRLPTGLVLFGGEGSMEIVKIAKALNHAGSPVQLILLCGRHQEAIAALRALPRRIPMAIEGFTKEVPLYMELADFFIGKPGPGSISEALAMRLPVIVEKNAWTLPQERYNADWVAEQQVGIVVNSFSRIRQAVGELLTPDRWATYQRNVRAIRNRAVFEVPALLDGILSRSAVRPGPPLPGDVAPPHARHFAQAG